MFDLLDGVDGLLVLTGLLVGLDCTDDEDDPKLLEYSGDCSGEGGATYEGTWSGSQGGMDVGTGATVRTGLGELDLLRDLMRLC